MKFEIHRDEGTGEVLRESDPVRARRAPEGPCLGKHDAGIGVSASCLPPRESLGRGIKESRSPLSVGFGVPRKATLTAAAAAPFPSYAGDNGRTRVLGTPKGFRCCRCVSFAADFA